MSDTIPHELVKVFAEQGFALNATLQEMLNEHYAHRTERRGCGFTQSTRHLSDYINATRADDAFDDLRLFQDWNGLELKIVLQKLAQCDIQVNWRHLDRHPDLLDRVGACADPELAAMVQQEIQRQQRLRALPDLLAREESKLLARIIVDIVLPVDAVALHLTELPGCPEKLKIGTCPMAEKFFLELSHEFIARHGVMNVILDTRGEPILVEKINMGDDHSCISLVPLVMNGVRLPVGTLIGVQYDEVLPSERRNKKMPGFCIDLERCQGFRYLRLTTLVVSPANRRRAFSTHFEAQQTEGLFAPDSTEVRQLLAVARKQL